MRSEIHAAVPLWINTPLEPPPIGFPVTERWRSLCRSIFPVGGAAGRGNRDHERGRLLRGGTGPYLRGVGFRMPADNALTYSLRSGQSSMVLTPGKERSLPYLLRQGGLRGCGQFHGAGGDRKRNRRGRADRGLHRQSARRAADEVGKGVRSSSARSSVSHGPADATWNRSSNNRAMIVSSIIGEQGHLAAQRLS